LGAVLSVVGSDIIAFMVSGAVFWRAVELKKCDQSYVKMLMIFENVNIFR